MLEHELLQTKHIDFETAKGLSERWSTTKHGTAQSMDDNKMAVFFAQAQLL